MRCKLKWPREFSDEDQEVVMREYYTIQFNSTKDQQFLCGIEVCDIKRCERKDLKGMKKCSETYWLFKSA